MITIIYSTHKDEQFNNKFKQHLLQSVSLKNVQILEYKNNNEFSLSEIYNKGISHSNFDLVYSEIFSLNDQRLFDKESAHLYTSDRLL